MMNGNSSHNVHGLGADWGGIFQAGAGMFDSIMDSRTANKSNESMERQLELQLQAQREQSQTDAARFGQTLKIVMIAGGVLLAGGVIFAIATSKAKDKDIEPNLRKKDNDLGRLVVLDGLSPDKSGAKRKRKGSAKLRKAA